MPTPLEARKALGLTREELAHRARVSCSLIYRCERHGTWPVQGRARKGYLRALGLTETMLKNSL